MNAKGDDNGYITSYAVNRWIAGP